MAAELLLMGVEYGGCGGWRPLAAGLLPLISDLVAEEAPRIVFREPLVLLLLGFDVLPFVVAIGALNVLVGIRPLSNPPGG
jgi:hypothetical protein